MSKPEKSLGKFLQQARESKQLSLRAVEKAVGISNAYISQLEGGKIKQPSPSVLHKLAELYDISYSKALELAGYPVPDQSTTDLRSNSASRIGPVTPDEEAELIEYLAFLRSKNKRKG
jgi:HTH-type transcriptional regulator, competence development regulator